MKISKWMKGFLSFLLSFTVMLTTMIQQNTVLADEGSIDPAEVIDEEMPASSPEAEATPAASEPVATPVALETAEPTVQPDETPAVQEADVQTESTPAEAPQAATAQPVETQEEAYVSPTSFDAETDNIKVHAETAEGAFNEPVTLVVNVLDEDTEDYKKVQETMDQNGSSQDGMLALDIRFENSSNQEVEPNGQVSISVVIKDAANEDIDQSSLQVTHLKEEDDGTLTLEKVADNDQNTDGYIRTADSNIEADFTAESFSVYAFSYERDTGRKEEASPSQEPTPESTADNLQAAAVSYAAGTAKSLTTKETVDSQSKGFHIYMVDMAYPWETTTGKYRSDGRLTQGIYTDTLNSKGYPEFKYSSKSLTYEFSKAVEVNHLFYKDTYDKTGYFYYSSAETFASLQSDNTFLVSQELGSPSGIDAFYFKRGNFFPYNTLNLRRVINRNLYDDKGNTLSPNADRYNEALYGMKEEVNYGFGLHAKAEFYQPVDGIVNGNQDMVYEFTGDDDMLVYIDGVLVLDLGGIHDAQSGTINFRTGVVTYTGATNGTSSTTIYKQYSNAGRLGTTTWSGKTFAAGTSHKIDIFYMERGAGASNLKMKVNIPPIPEGTVAVTKQVEGLDASQAAEETYTMKLFVNGTAAANKQYTMSDNPAEQLTTDAEGRFSLKAGQTAMFSSIGANNTVRVEEIADKDTIYRVSYQRYDSNGNAITDSNDTITVPSAGHVAVTVKNNAAEHTNNLTITKQFMMNGQDVSGVINMDAFKNATFTLQESKDNGSNWKDLYTISYSSFQNNSYTFRQLDPRSQYRVIENLTETTNGSNVSYSYNGTVSSFNDTNGNTTSPVISLRDDDAAVVFTNNYGTRTYPLTIRKSFDGIESLPSNFQITIDGSTEMFTVANKKGGSGTVEDPYWWSTDAAYNSTLTIRESGYETDNYELAAGTETSRQITIGPDSNVVEFENHYVPKTYSFILVKKFVGITKDEIPQNFQIEGNGRTYVLRDGTPSEDGLTYTWTDYAAYGSTLTFTESNANVTGYSLTASNNGTASLTIASSGNRAEITNTYTPKDYTVTVTKVFEGLDSDADFSNFEMQANVNSVVTAKKISDASGDGTASHPYTWTFEAPYKSTVTFEEANYQIKGFSRTNNDATTKSITVSASNEINKVSFTNVYQKNTGEDVNELPTLNILKKDNKGNALSQAEFTLFDPDGNAIWHDVTNTEGKLSVDFSKYTFSANQTSYQFTLKETNAPTGYTASSETYTFTVNLKDGDPEIKYDSANNWFQNFYHWIVGNRSSASYDAASSTLTVVNTINQYTYKIVKTFSGVNDLPDTFVITDQNGRQYTLKDAAKQGNTYTWTGTADYDTEFRLTESGMDIHGYVLASTVNGQIETSGTLKVTAEEKNNVITFSNTYTAQPRTITVTKQFNGLTGEEVPAGFAITGLGEDLTLENATKTDDFTYQWTRDVAYGTNLTLSETGYAVSGYQVAAAVNGNPGTGIELTVGDDNNISFVNSYSKKYSEDDDVHTPSFTIHKVDQDGKLLEGATFTLTDSNNNVVWTGTTDGENDLTADFANFDFGTDPSAKFNFTLHEDAPVGYTGAEDWTITVSEDDGVVSLRKESDEDFFHKIYNWLIKDSFDKAYDQTSKVLTVTNTVNSYDFTVTKSFTGVEALPEDFQITDSLGNVYKLDDKNIQTVNGVYTWTKSAPYGTEVTFTEENYEVTGYNVTAKANDVERESASLRIGTDKKKNVVAFSNEYKRNSYHYTVTKTFSGITKDEIPADFQITDSNGAVYYKNNADAVSNDGLTYTWIRSADYGTQLTFTESGYNVSGYTIATEVHTADGTGSSLTVSADEENNYVAFTNTYTEADVSFTVTKTFSGVEVLPDNFEIVDSLGNKYTLKDENVKAINGGYTWTGTAKYKTEITFTEYNFDVDGYSVESTANGSNGTSNTLTVTADPAKNAMAFNNVYTANTYDVIVTKGFTGIDALPDTFKITGVGNEVFTIDNAVSGTGTLSDPYVWTAKAVYGTTLKIQESGYAVSGYTTVAAVNGKAGDVTEIKVNTKDNTVAFTNSYVMNFSDANDVTKPGFILHKVDQNGKALAGAGFTLYDQNNNVVWSGTTAADGVLSVNFDSFDFGENAKAVHTFTLRETSVPEGYTGAADLTLTVKEDDGKVDLVKKDGEDYYHKVYHWVITDGLGKNYDAASNILTVTNTAIAYPFTIVKTFSGVDALPDTFVITDQNGNQYTLNDDAKQGNTYTWTGMADYGTELQLSERNNAIHGYDLAATVNGQNGTSGTLRVTAEEKNNVITFSNTYTAQPRTITVTKQFNGLTGEEVPAGFAITGLGEDLTLENATKTDDFTYQWTRDVAYGTNLTLSETGYAVSGYQVAAAVNGNPGTGIELTVGDDNNISFVNSYSKKYSEDDDVHTPSFTIHKVDQDGKLLEGATFTLTDSNNNVVWTGTTDGENDLTADFANFDFGTDPSAKFNFTLHEDAPVGYTGAEDWTITVSEDDGVVSLRKESDEDFFHKIYNWLIKDSFDKAYDQTSKVLTVTNTVNSYEFTVTKSFTGVEALPEDFQITDSLGNVYTLDDAKSTNGTYTWTGKADYGTKVTFTENGYQVNGYDVTTSVNGKDGTSAEITIGTSNNNVDFVNSYEAGTYMVRVTKSFTGVDELPDTFAITGAGENVLTAADAVSGTGTADDPYVWNVEAKFGTILNIAETGYETEGYDVTATVNGNAGTSMQIQVGTGSNNVTFNNAYSLKKTDVVLSAEKNLIGRDLKAGEFNFEAYEGDQLVAEGTNDADGNIVFSTIHDVTYGTHTYTLKEVDQGLGGMTYDDNAYEVTVEVIDQDGTAKAVLPETKPVFTNTYSAQDGSAVIEARKNLTGRDAQNGEFSFELVQDGKTIATAVNEDGKVVFGPISWTMDEIGTYTYTIREVAGTDANIVYDSHEETVTVTVSDNGDGTLHIEVAYDEDSAVFNNTYEPTVPHTDDDNPKPSPTPSSDPAPLPAVPSTSDNGKPTSNSSKTPQTGVNSDVTTWVWLGSSSLLALFIALILRRRKEESK